MGETDMSLSDMKVKHGKGYVEYDIELSPLIIKWIESDYGLRLLEKVAKELTNKRLKNEL